MTNPKSQILNTKQTLNPKSKTPKVYFLPIEKVNDKSLTELFSTAGFESIINKDALVAVKLHFGEMGNNAYIKPRFVKPIVEKVLSLSAKPFLTDSNTLYKGTRGDAYSHINTAMAHGFCFSPVIIADGLNGKDYETVEIGLKHFKEVKIGSAARQADAMVVMTHFKGHELTGFGGALKNIGMGLGARSGKQQMHSDVHPSVDSEKCTGCGLCTKWCPVNAISMKDAKAVIDSSKCIGCAECIVTCNFNAISTEWSGSSRSVQEKIAEYAFGAVKDKKCVYMNVITEVSPNCDCWNFNKPPIVKDIGILASFDPVAIDQACADLVNKEAKKDIIKETWPEIDWTIQLQYAEEIGLGSRKYEIVDA